jgi:hypothetical protein
VWPKGARSAWKIFAAAGACFLLAQCSAPTGPQANANAAAPLCLQGIAGQWDIVSFDGYRPARLDGDGQRHAFVDIRGDEFSFAIECNYSGMSARLERDRMVATTSDNVQTAMGCGPEREARDAAFFAFLRGGPRIVSHTEQALALEGEGIRLDLQRPDLRRRSLLPANLSEIEGAWRADILYWRVEPGQTNNLLADLAGGAARVTIASGEVRLAFDCENLSAPAAFSGPGEITLQSVTRTNAANCSLSQADRDKAASLLNGVLSAEHIPPDRLYLSAGDVYAVLRRD